MDRSLSFLLIIVTFADHTVIDTTATELISTRANLRYERSSTRLHLLSERSNSSFLISMLLDQVFVCNAGFICHLLCLSRRGWVIESHLPRTFEWRIPYLSWDSIEQSSAHSVIFLKCWVGFSVPPMINCCNISLAVFTTLAWELFLAKHHIWWYEFLQ